MAQYHMFHNLDRKEFIDPHAFDVGLKLFEQLGTSYLDGLHILLCACPKERDDGDYHNLLEIPEGADVIGRWAGERIALLGEYGEAGDMQHRNDCTEGNTYCSAEYKDISAIVAPVVASWRKHYN